MALIKRYETPIQGNYKLAILKYGSLTGLLMCLLVVARFLLNKPLVQPLGYVENIFFFAFLLLFTYLYRKSLKGNPLFFKEAYLLNIGMGIITAVFYAIFMTAYVKWIDMDFLPRYVSFKTEELKSLGETINEDNLKTIGSARYISSQSFILTTVLSIIFALIVALVMRTQKNIVREKKK